MVRYSFTTCSPTGTQLKQQKQHVTQGKVLNTMNYLNIALTSGNLPISSSSVVLHHNMLLFKRDVVRKSLTNKFAIASLGKINRRLPKMPHNIR